MRRSRVIGCGGYLPGQVVSNQDLTAYVDTNDAWIVERTGIRQRHLAADGEFTSDLGTAAARAALQAADLRPAAVDLLVLATSTPDNTFPASATAIQRKLGMDRGCAFDVQAVCSGFVYALSVADSFLKSGQAQTALVIGAETFSRILDWQDRGTCVLFGDGAGAVVLRSEPSHDDMGERGILGTVLGSDGRHYEQLWVDGGPSTTGTAGHLRMNGREVYRHAVNTLADASRQVLETVGLTLADVDWLIPHQANRRIIDGVGRRLGLPEGRVVVTVDRHANTSAASIPLALEHAVRDGRIKPHHLLVLNAMGGGFTWGAIALRW